MVTNDSEGPFWGKKVEAPSKSGDFHGPPLVIPKFWSFAQENDYFHPQQKAAIGWYFYANALEAKAFLGLFDRPFWVCSILTINSLLLYIGRGIIILLREKP